MSDYNYYPSSFFDPPSGDLEGIETDEEDEMSTPEEEIDELQGVREIDDIERLIEKGVIKI
jgi:hypothetical protein